MAKKDKNIINLDENGNEIDGKAKGSTVLITFIFIVIWLGVFALLIKLDVGGFAGTVLKPIFKDVPIIKEILPNTTQKEELEQYNYKSLAEAIAYIRELESVQKTNLDTIASQKDKIADLESEIIRLKTFETEQDNYLKIREEFYNEVVFGEDALDYEEYKKYYESISPEAAEKLYKQVIEQYLFDEQYKELANAYTNMTPKKAAATLYEMTGNLDSVVAILQSMDAEPRAAILDALSDVDPVYAAKVTVLLSP